MPLAQVRLLRNSLATSHRSASMRTPMCPAAPFSSRNNPIVTQPPPSTSHLTFHIFHIEIDHNIEIDHEQPHHHQHDAPRGRHCHRESPPYRSRASEHCRQHGGRSKPSTEVVDIAATTSGDETPASSDEQKQDGPEPPPMLLSLGLFPPSPPYRRLLRSRPCPPSHPPIPAACLTCSPWSRRLAQTLLPLPLPLCATGHDRGRGRCRDLN